MKKMSTVSMREANGGCSHVAYCLYSRNTVYKLPWSTKVKYTWLCGKCGKKFNTYAYF